MTKLNTLLLQGNSLTYLPKELSSCALATKEDGRLRLANNPLLPFIVEKLKVLPDASPQSGMQNFLKYMKDKPDEYMAFLIQAKAL